MVSEAVFTAVGHGNTEESITRSKIIEAAMVAAVQRLHAKGIVDPDILRTAMLEARDEAVANL